MNITINMYAHVLKISTYVSLQCHHVSTCYNTFHNVSHNIFHNVVSFFASSSQQWTIQQESFQCQTTKEDLEVKEVETFHNDTIGTKKKRYNGNSRDNSIDNVKEKGRSKRSVDLSHQHNTNWGHENMMVLINCKHNEHIALKQVFDRHFNMIPTYKDGTNYQMTCKQSHPPIINKMCKNIQVESISHFNSTFQFH
jgi:hypothetical protein